MIGVIGKDDDDISIGIVLGNNTILMGQSVGVETGKPSVAMWSMDEPLLPLPIGEKYSPPDRSPDVVLFFENERCIDDLQKLLDFVKQTFKERDASKYDDQIGTGSESTVSDSETDSSAIAGTESVSEPTSN
jgi:hypothetical protein